jgi:hypothetical protein
MTFPGQPEDLLKLIETEGDVVAGTYRVKTEEGDTPEFYMGTWETNPDFTPKVQSRWSDQRQTSPRRVSEDHQRSS